MGAESSTVRIEIARLPAAEGLPLPSRATSGSAGYDLCAAVQRDLELAPGDRVLVPTGYRFAIPPGYEGQIRPRSGLALSHGILVPNAPGTIDSDYRGELRVILLNAGEKSCSIGRGDRIAQLVIAPVSTAEFCECDQLEETGRGEGGFGHSGRDARGSES
jgi:dUTP pyrophosphatase